MDARWVAVGTAACTPWIVNPTLMMLEEACVSTCGVVADTARMVSRASRRTVLNWGVVEVVEGGWMVGLLG